MNLQDPSLNEVVTSGNASAARVLLSAGADANQTNSGGQTPLILSIIAGHTQLIPLLLEAGANPHLRDGTGLNAIEWAERKGLPDVARLLANPSQATSNSATPPSHVPEQGRRTASNGGGKSTSADEKSRKWLAGLKQRLDERANRLPAISDEAGAQKMDKAQAHLKPPDDTEDPVPAPRIPVAEPSAGLVKASTSTNPKVPGTRTSSSRKRCPQCNTYYNSELLAYCAYDTVALVDADEPIVVPPSKNRMTPLLWLLVLLVLGGAVGLAYLLVSPLYDDNRQNEQPSALALRGSGPGKGIPIAGGDLRGKVLAMPEAQTSSMVNGQTAVVTVRVKVDKTGHVISALTTGGEDPFQRAALEAARKAVFSVPQLRGRAAEGTITYTFKR